jgi:hypothetical protein
MRHLNKSVMAIIACLWASLAFGQANNDSQWQTPGNAIEPGIVQLCINAAGKAVPCATAVAGAAGFPNGATPITGSGTGTTSSTATLTSTAGKTTYICGFSVGVSGATAVGTGTVVVSGTITGSLNFAIPQVVVTANNQTGLTVPMTPCVPASGLATNIVVTSTMGAGTTNNATAAWGFNQ